MVRLIVASPADGSLDHEDICWTEDFDAPAQDFVRNGFSISIDKKMDIELPAAFPLEHTFSR
jgi:hypothetical protein